MGTPVRIRISPPALKALGPAITILSIDGRRTISTHKTLHINGPSRLVVQGDHCWIEAELEDLKE